MFDVENKNTAEAYLSYFRDNKNYTVADIVEIRGESGKFKQYFFHCFHSSVVCFCITVFALISAGSQ